MPRTAKTSLTLPSLPAEADVFTATFALIAEKGLGKARLSMIAEQMGTDLTSFYAEYQSVEAIIGRFLDHLDLYVVQNNTKSGSKRDLYFDMLMNRFDELQKHRAGVTRWLKDTAKHPVLGRKLLKRWDRTLSLMLDLAQDSPVFIVKKIGLAGVYAYCLREWLRDDTDDMAKTMVAVDKALGHADDFVMRYLSPKKST